MKRWSLKHIILLVTGLIIGAGAGYAYWLYIGCNSGTCMITSSARNSTLYGLVMGGLLASTIWDFVKERKIKRRINKL